MFDLSLGINVKQSCNNVEVDEQDVEIVDYYVNDEDFDQVDFVCNDCGETHSSFRIDTNYTPNRVK